MDTRRRVLFVDDEPNILRSYRRLLFEFENRWDMAFDNCPRAAYRRLQNESFDTIVCDMRMPGMSGLQLLEKIKSHDATKDVPFVIVTGNSDKDLKRRALDLDATDLLNKPVEPNELVSRIKSALRTKEYADRLKRQNDMLEERVRQRTAELAASREDIIWRLGKAAEYRDEETGNHVVRVASFSRVVAREMGLDQEFYDTLYLAAPLHDIGKIGIKDSVLLKPGKLDSVEWEQMQKHCEIGVAILTADSHFHQVVATQIDPNMAAAPQDVSQDVRHGENSVMSMAATIAATHHERWDGEGYPHGLSGESIPLASRIVAIADVYDALRSRRPYKEPFSVEKSLAILREGSGSHFDPQVVDAFMNAYNKIACIEAEFEDNPAPANLADTSS